MLLALTNKLSPSDEVMNPFNQLMNKLSFNIW